MVEIWGDIISVISSILATAAEIFLFNSFFLRKINRKSYYLIIALWIVTSTLLVLFVGNRYGYTFKIVLELIFRYLLCSILYEGRPDRRLFVVVTIYAVLYSYAYWFDYLCTHLLKITIKEYIWNIPLYSTIFLARVIFILGISIIVWRLHHPLAVGKQARAWIPLSVVFPVSTLFLLWYVYTHSAGEVAWQLCLLILDIVDIVAIVLLDYIEQSALNREKLVAATERAHVQDENIQALSQAYSGQRKMTHDFRTQLTTLSELLECGEIEDAKNYLYDLKVHQSERILLVNSHNAAIDAVLNQKGYIGQKYGVDMRFRVNDLSALKLSRVDVTIVLGNLIDNAIEACVKLPENEKWVSIQVVYNDCILSVSIINPCGPVKTINGHYPTTKDNPLLHGFGLSNVTDILKKYRAEYTLRHTDNRFIVSIDWPDVS